MRKKDLTECHCTLKPKKNIRYFRLLPYGVAVCGGMIDTKLLLCEAWYALWICRRVYFLCGTRRGQC